MLNAAVTVRMREAGGRAVERSLDIGIRPQSSMIGIRPDFAGSEVPQGGTASFSVIAADPEGRRVALPGALWKLVRIDRNYQWYRANGYWNYEPVTFTTAVAGGTIDIPASGEASISQTVDWGRYRLEIETPDPAGPATSHEFDAGWYVAASSTETPDGLEIALDKEEYAPGEVARLKISPRFAASFWSRSAPTGCWPRSARRFPKREPRSKFRSARIGARAPMSPQRFTVPANRSRRGCRPGQSAVKWLQIDPAGRKLEVALDAPAQSEPRQTLPVPVTVAGAAPGSDAYVMVAAVDGRHPST